MPRRVQPIRAISPLYGASIENCNTLFFSSFREYVDRVGRDRERWWQNPRRFAQLLASALSDSDRPEWRILYSHQHGGKQLYVRAILSAQSGPA